MEVSEEPNIEQNKKILSAEIILYDVLYNIFKYLNICDLNQAARVCKSWYYAAKIEKLRRGPQIMILQALEDYIASKFSNISPIDENEVVDDFKLSLRIKPRAGLFFTDGKYPSTADCDSVPYEICRAHEWTQPKNCYYVAVEALGINVDNKAIGGERNITLAIFLPDLPTVHYAITETSSHCIQQYFTKSNSVLTDIADRLFTSNVDHVCFIVFIYQWKGEPTFEQVHGHFLAKILETLKSRYDPGTYSLWGGAINDVFTMATDGSPSYQPTSFCAMSISGSSMKSWSIVLNNNLPESELQEKLQNFKKRVRLETSSLAFIILPTDEDNIDRSKIDIFKNIFPKITLISIFNDKNNAVLSVDSTSNEPNPELKHMNAYAFMILTYKF